MNRLLRNLRNLRKAVPRSPQDCYEESPEMCRYILWRYEEHLARESGAGASVYEHERNAIWKKRARDSIEHIFPQNPWRVPAWKGKMQKKDGPEEDVFRHVGRIGNLILLPATLNQQAQTKPFAEKKQLYARHKLRMIDEILPLDDWTLEEIESREARIVDWARTQWCDV